ncbi:MAG TPA: 23S rRNA (uracil(1939)-C(5))-methyltransferase RlmD [Tenuifilaceae bacterium]|nr:23S rRNA (uracil(1939)-C(5))-methyltransferase RlmD [Tenuifilaceae bacterium]
MNKRKYPIIEGVKIEGIAAEGNAIARVNNKVLFVPYVIPGDVVDVQVVSSRKSYMEGYVVKLIKKSDLRVEPFCSHFGTCGGCKWQSLPYSEQLKFKQGQVSDQLTRIGKIDLPEISPIIGSKNTTHYRNKLEFTFSDSRWLTKEEIESGEDFGNQPALGYHIPKRFDRVFDVNTCYLQPEPSNAIRLGVKKFALEKGIPFLNLRSKEGILRNLIVRTSSAGDVMVILSVKQFIPQVKELLDFIAETFPQVTSLFYVENTKVNDTINDLDLVLYKGNDHIVEQMEDIKFKVGPKSFYQTNSKQALELYRVAREFAGLTGNELVYDLYTGTGTIANFIAAQAKHVVGVEYVPEAIDDAWENSRINNIKNTSFYAGDIKDLLTDDFIGQNGRPDVVILDPPRAGVHPDVVKMLMQVAPRRIVYVSCNPATQARDIALMGEGYRVARIQPVDMFPQTHHVENVVLLERI